MAPCQYVQGPGPTAGAVSSTIHYCSRFECRVSPENICSQACDAGDTFTVNSVITDGCYNSGQLGIPCGCFARQIDYYTQDNGEGTLAGYILHNRTLSDAECLSQPPPTPSPSPTAQCTALRFYQLTGSPTDPNAWGSALTQTQINALRPGDIVYITIMGTIANGVIDRARIRVNSTTWTPANETTIKKPNTDEYYVTYTIPNDGTTSFVTGGEIHEQTQDRWY